LAAQDISATVSGRIRPAIQATDIVLTLQSQPHTLFSVRLDDQGRFRFSVLPAGTYTLTITRPGFKTLNVRSIAVGPLEQKTLPLLHPEVAPTDVPWLPIAYYELRAEDEQHGNLSGRVVRSEGRALARARVRLFNGDSPAGETRTDEDGRFSFLNLVPGDDYSIRVTRTGYQSWEGTGYTVQAGYDAVYQDIVLRRANTSRAATTVR
jgi:hypothetical protein